MGEIAIRHSQEELSAFGQRAQDLYRELFRGAHALTGNIELAELTLGGALLTAYLHRREWQGRMGTREGMMRAIASVGFLEMEDAQEEYEEDWNGLSAVPGDSKYPDVSELLSRQPPQVRRMLVMRYGMRMDLRRIALALSIKEGVVREEISKVYEQVVRMPGGEGGPYGGRGANRAILQAVRADMNRPDDDLPDISMILSEVERDAADSEGEAGRLGTALKVLLTVLAALICAILFWVVAILMEAPIAQRPYVPAGIEVPAPQPTFDGYLEEGTPV